MYGYKFHSWGANKFTNVYNYALKFNVNGHHHKGHVYIMVNGSDLYDVFITTNRGTILDTFKDIYFEDLFDVIDKRIEYISDYSE